MAGDSASPDMEQPDIGAGNDVDYDIEGAPKSSDAGTAFAGHDLAANKLALAGDL